MAAKALGYFVESYYGGQKCECIRIHKNCEFISNLYVMLDFTKETSYRSNESENALHVFKSILKKKYFEFYELGVKLLCNKAHCQMTVTDTTKSLRKKKLIYR